MKIKPKERSGFGFDLIVGFLLLVIPMVAFVVILFMDIWMTMRVNNDLKLLNHQVANKLVNISDDTNSWDDEYAKIAPLIAILGNTFCPKSKNTLKLLSTEANSGDLIESTISVTMPTTLLGDKKISNTIIVSSYDPTVNAKLNYECQ